MQEDIIKDSKNFKQSKCQNIKKNTDALIIVQKDLQNCVKDFHKIRSEYKNEGDEKTNNKILKKNRKRIKPNASTTNAFVLSMLAANTHQVLIKMKFLLYGKHLFLGQILFHRPSGFHATFGDGGLSKNKVSGFGIYCSAYL